MGLLSKFTGRGRQARRLRCVFCGAAEIDWPTHFSDEFHEQHACLSGRGHFYSDDPFIAALVWRDAMRGRRRP